MKVNDVMMVLTDAEEYRHLSHRLIYLYLEPQRTIDFGDRRLVDPQRWILFPINAEE
jgi:hypothetical protein